MYNYHRQLPSSLQMHFQDKSHSHPNVMQKPEFRFHLQNCRKSSCIRRIYICNFHRPFHIKDAHLQIQLFVIYVPLFYFLSSDVGNVLIPNIFTNSNYFECLSSSIPFNILQICSGSSGSFVILIPVALWIAFAIAGATGAAEPSPHSFAPNGPSSSAGKS